MLTLRVQLCEFYAAANSIYLNSKYASEILKLYLLESYCLPLISYTFIHSFINTHKAAEKKHYTHNIHTIKVHKNTTQKHKT